MYEKIGSEKSVGCLRTVIESISSENDKGKTETGQPEY
jgi:hypothetical protein